MILIILFNTDLYVFQLLKWVGKNFIFGFGRHIYKYYRYYDYLLFTKGQNTPLCSIRNLSPDVLDEDDGNNEDIGLINSFDVIENSTSTNEQICIILNIFYF